MPSIEISLSSDSQCIGSPRSESDDDVKSTVALYDDQAVMHENLAELRACTSHNGDYYHDLIEVHDEMEDNVSDSETDVFHNEQENNDAATYNQKLSNKKSSGNGLVGGFASMIQYNFASRATMLPMNHIQKESKRGRSPYHAVNFADHRM